MSIYVECALADTVLPVHRGDQLLWSEAIAAPGTSDHAVPDASLGLSRCVVTVTARSADAYVAFGEVPDAGDPDRRWLVEVGAPRTFEVPAGAKIAWVAV
ncbi:hypothetical protein [Chelatococcus sp.]|uniref:hypothetical protein n=1 Tax=Chelatococcus sp. TaxID=1953771 RepID=UPI001ECBE4B2|nr:hypothetical protein [Chelatococcus sp.]MBX3545600.1 hypothetical protein [Chelatococcus sp.]